MRPEHYRYFVVLIALSLMMTGVIWVFSLSQTGMSPLPAPTRADLVGVRSSGVLVTPLPDEKVKISEITIPLYLSVQGNMVTWLDNFWQGYDLTSDAYFTIPVIPAQWQDAMIQQISPVTELPLWYSPLDSPLPPPISLEPFDAIQRAISVTNELFPSISGSPEVIFSNSITPDRFSDFGLDEYNFGTTPPPMSFALVHGNFDTTDFGIGNKVSFSSARYIGYVFDLSTRAVMIVSVSGNGEKFH